MCSQIILIWWLVAISLKIWQILPRATIITQQWQRKQTYSSLSQLTLVQINSWRSTATSISQCKSCPFPPVMAKGSVLFEEKPFNHLRFAITSFTHLVWIPWVLPVSRKRGLLPGPTEQRILQAVKQGEAPRAVRIVKHSTGTAAMPGQACQGEIPPGPGAPARWRAAVRQAQPSEHQPRVEWSAAMLLLLLVCSPSSPEAALASPHRAVE